jgi:hypothetical protein
MPVAISVAYCAFLHVHSNNDAVKFPPVKLGFVREYCHTSMFCVSACHDHEHAALAAKAKSCQDDGMIAVETRTVRRTSGRSSGFIIWFSAARNLTLKYQAYDERRKNTLSDTLGR